MNVAVVSQNINTKHHSLILVQAVVDGGQLLMFVNTTDEMSMFKTNSVKTLYAPFFVADDNGYNSGNLLIGLLSRFFDIFFVSRLYLDVVLFCSGYGTAGWCVVAVESIV